MSADLAALLPLLAAGALVAVLTALALRFRDACRKDSRDRREAERRAAARHPARRQARRAVPDDRGCKPLTAEELDEFTGIMTCSTTRDQDQDQERREP